MTEAVTKAFPGAPRTADPGTGNWLSGDLPSDLLHAASRRLIVFMYSVAAVEAFYLFLFLVVLSAHARTSAQINATVVIAISVLLARHLRRPHALSWLCVIIVFFPLLVPARPLQTLLGSTMAALAAPAAMATAVASGKQTWPDFAVALAMFIPPFICAGLACVPAYVMTGMSAVVRRARHLGSYWWRQNLPSLLHEPQPGLDAPARR